MRLEDCTCTSVDSPLANAVAAIDIVTFLIAVVGLLLAAIAIYRSYRSAYYDLNRFREVYKASDNEIKLFRLAFGLIPDYFEVDGQPGVTEGNTRGTSTALTRQQGMKKRQ